MDMRSPFNSELCVFTFSDQEKALSEGWGVFDNSDYGMRIERHGDRFDSDAAAIAYVAQRAVAGGALERRAIEDLAWHHAVKDAADGDLL